MKDDEAWMRRALALANEAAERGEVPVGALVVHEGQLLAEASNRRNEGHDPMGHAEVLALRDAALRRGTWRMDEVTLYVTLEPCTMCSGLLVQSRLGRLVFGARDERMGGIRSLFQIADDPRAHHRVDVVEGVLATECAELLRSFFRERRIGR